MDNPTSQRKISKGREKKGHHKLYTQPREPVISLSSCHGVSGSSGLPGMKGIGSTAGIVPSKTQQSLTNKHKHKEDDVLGSDHDVFVKPKVTRRRRSSSSSDEKSLASRLPQCHSPLQRKKLRQSLSRTSPRGNFSGSMKRRHTVSMTRNDMKKLQEAIDDNQRKKKMKNANGMAQIDSSPFKVPHPKKGEKEVCEEAMKQIKGLKRLSYQKRDQSLEGEEPDMYKEIATFKQKENTVSSHLFTQDVSGKHDSKPNKDFQRMDGMYNPSQELFTDIESGNETDTRAIVQRTVSRFLSSQDAQNDFRTPNCRMVQRTSHVAGVLDSESQVSESSEDEASETVLEKEVRSFFESKKKHFPRGHREVAPASEMAQTHIQVGVVDLGMSDESEIICAGQKIRSQIENDNVMGGYDTDLSTPDSDHNHEDGQRLSDDTSSTCNHGVAKGDINFEQEEKGENNAEDVVSEEDKSCNQLQTTSQTDSDVEMASLSEEVDNSPLTGIESGELGETSHLLFHSTPADPIHHTKQQKAQARTAVPTSLIQTEKDMFQLYCHKETAPRILEALKMCENIDGSTLASRNLDDGPTRLEVICGKVFEDEAERTSSVSSPVLFDENSDEVDGIMEIEGAEQMSKQVIRDSTKKKGKDMLLYDAQTKPKPKKGKKKKKRKKVMGNPGDNLVKTRLKVICGPIKGDARKKNEHRWIRETRDQSKCYWSEITVEPSLESDLGMLRCLKAAARAALKQRETPQDRDADLEEDDPDLGTFINLVSFPDVFMTKKKDQPSFREVPQSEIQVLDGF